jgi:hypothetical protein
MLRPVDVACWVLKTSVPPHRLQRGWEGGTSRLLTRCLRRSYRLALMLPGQPCLLWLSGRDRPGVHALGVLATTPREEDGGPVVDVRLTLLAEPVLRADLLADPRTRDAEVLRMPAGSNPSWLSPGQFAAIGTRIGDGRLQPWGS